MERVEKLIYKQPKEIQKQWLDIAVRGKFELDAAELSCKNWPQIVSNPFFRPKNILETFNGLSPSLATLKKYQSEMLTSLIVCKIIKDTANFFNVGGAINDYQIQQTTILIIDKFYYFNIADFILCFKMAKAGKFGKLFDRLDGAIILDWLEQYNELRLLEAQNNSEKIANDSKTNKITIGSSIYKALKDCTDKKANETKEPIKKVSKMTKEQLEEKRRADIETIKLMYKKTKK